MYASDHPEDKTITAALVSSHDDLVKQEHRMYGKAMGGRHSPGIVVCLFRVAAGVTRFR